MHEDPTPTPEWHDAGVKALTDRAVASVDRTQRTVGAAVTLRDDQALALQWALRQIDTLAKKVDELGRAPRTKVDMEFFTSTMQTVWWIAALNNFSYEIEDDEYCQRRDGHTFGGEVRAMMWCRDRAMYQVPIAMGRDVTPFYPTNKSKSAVLNIAASGPVWRTRAELPPPRKGRERFEADYDQHAASKEVSATLLRCLDFFKHETNERDTPLWFAVHANVDPSQFTFDRERGG